MIPEKYANETDYRKIPREYLNPNIPQGRGMKKWLSMATIPEQYERLEQYIQDQNKIEKPLLSEDQIENINDTLASKMIDNTLAKIQYFANGYIKSVEGIIHKVDTLDSLVVSDNNYTSLEELELLETELNINDLLE
ncbi:YolD-like family protein [Staphylococcus aureus]|uniref:YolD-like family protein n=1 Tax=Staphylococcus aureus TaxID=1280 RepID=UPI000BA71F71|nr:YolD-like family protein [Staphylococcus aureus]PAG12035.1 hypothetical protein APV43_14250 [Staphylococcus aureus]